MSREVQDDSDPCPRKMAAQWREASTQALADLSEMRLRVLRQDAVMQQALDALETIPAGGADLNQLALTVAGVTLALRAALEAPQPEPVKGAVWHEGSVSLLSVGHEDAYCARRGAQRLYLHPPAAPQGEPVAIVCGPAQHDRLRVSGGAVVRWTAGADPLPPETRLYTAPPAAPSAPEVTDEMVEAAENYLRSILNGASLPRRYMRGILHAALSEKSAAPSVPAPGYCKHCKQYTIEDPLPASQWIACSEQLPDADIEVLAWVVGEPFWDGHCWIATYDGHGWNADEGRYALRGVTHWMDLPGEPGC